MGISIEMDYLKRIIFFAIIILIIFFIIRSMLGTMSTPII